MLLDVVGGWLGGGVGAKFDTHCITCLAIVEFQTCVFSMRLLFPIALPRGPSCRNKNMQGSDQASCASPSREAGSHAIPGRLRQEFPWCVGRCRAHAMLARFGRAHVKAHLHLARFLQGNCFAVCMRGMHEWFAWPEHIAFVNYVALLSRFQCMTL